MEQSASPSLGEPSLPCYVVGIDVGSESCRFCILTSDKRIVIKPTTFANAASGLVLLTEKLEALGVSAHHILIGLEATSRYGENLYHCLQSRGYQMCLLHPRQTHQFAQQRGLRAKTDTLDASTIARVLLSGEARPGYVPDDLIATYRELVRLHTQLSDEVARYKNAHSCTARRAFPRIHTAICRSLPGYGFGSTQTLPKCSSLRRSWGRGYC